MSLVSLSVVQIILLKPTMAGPVPIECNVSDKASGVYSYRLEAGSFAETKKMMLMK